MNTFIKNIDDYPGTNKAILLLFCGYVIIWYLQIGYRMPALGRIRFEFIYAAFLTLIAMMSPQNKLDLSCPITKFIIAYFICLIIQIPFSHNFAQSWDVFVNRIVKFAFMAFFIICFVKSPRDLVFFLCAFMLACMKMGQEGFIGQLTGSMSWYNQGIMRLHGATPLYGHPNSFTGMALGTLPFVYYLFSISPKYIKVLLSVQLVFAINIIIFSGSRTGYVGIIILVLFIFIKSNKKKNLLVLGTVIFMFSFQFIPEQYAGRFETIFTQEDKVGRSTELRKGVIKDAWEVFVTYPFGIGVGAFPSVRRDMFGRTQDTHNLYLEVATNLGIQGLIIFFLFVFKMLKLLNKLEHDLLVQIDRLQNDILEKDHDEDVRIRKKTHLSELCFMKMTCCAVSSFVVLRLVLGLFGMDLYEIYWWFALGLTISLYNMNSISKLKTEQLLLDSSTSAV
jgi:hypothetical protein